MENQNIINEEKGNDVNHVLCTVFDFFLSRIKLYRKLCGGIWRNVNIIENPEYAGGFAVNTWSGWVREDWNTTKKYWTKNVEAYGNEFHERAKNIKAFRYSLK